MHLNNCPQATDEALDVLGFKQEEKDCLFKATIAICFLGNAKWKQKVITKFKQKLKQKGNSK